MSQSRVWTGITAGEVNLGDRIFRVATGFFAALIILTLAAMGVGMAQASAESLGHFGLGFVTGTDWDPVHNQFGALPFIVGTLYSSLIALILAVPLSLGTAIFVAELAPAWVRRPVGFLVELLAAIPSVVYGLWGIFVLAPFLLNHVQPSLAHWFGWLPFFKGTPRGFGMLAGGVILAIMILPTIASVSRDVMLAVPSAFREGALALGATRWEAIRTAVLPSARSGIVGAIILGLGRALGETMAVTMVIGNTSRISPSVFHTSATMASVIANEYTEASSDLYLSALTEIALLLFVVTIVVNIIARLLVWRMKKPVGAGKQSGAAGRP